MVLLKHEGGENGATSLKEGVDMRLSERRHIRNHFQITSWQGRGQLWI